MSAALFRGSVEVAVCAQRQTTDWGAAMNGVEVVQNLVAAGGSDLENEALIVGAPGGDGSVEISIPALRHHERILRTTTATSEVPQIGVGLGGESRRCHRNHKENLG